MNMILWKDVREQWLKVLGAAACLFAIEAWAMGIFDRQQFMDDPGAGFLIASAFGCPVLGLALAFSQFLPELRRDRWASLLHLPIARNVYFERRMLAGLALYLVGAGIPYLLCIALAAAPGVIAAPFTPQIPIGGAVDVATGILFYLGAAAGLWQTRHGFLRRALPAVAALLLGLWSSGMQGLDLEAVAVALVVSISLLGLACFYVARTQGSSPRPPWVFRAAMTVVTTIGLVGPLIVGIYVTLMLVAGLIFARSQEGSWSVWLADPAAGGPVRTYNSGGQHSVVEKIMKPDGTIVPAPPEQGAEPAADVGAVAYFTEVCAAAMNPDYPESRPTYSYRERNHYVLQAPQRWLRNARGPLLIWSYLREARVFVAYSWESRQPVFWLGVNGVNGQLDHVTPFPEDTVPIVTTVGPGGLYLWSGETLYYSDFAKQETRVVFTGQGRIVNAITTNLYGLAPQPNATSAVVVATTTGLTIVPTDNVKMATPVDWKPGPDAGLPDPKPITLPYTRDVASRGRIAVASPRARKGGGPQFYLRYSPTLVRPSQLPTTNDEVELMDAKGRVLDSFTLLHAWVTPTEPEAKKSFPARAATMSASIILPPVLVVITYCSGDESWHRSDVPADPNRIGGGEDQMPLVYAIFGVGVLFAAGTFALARRRGLSKRHAWRWAAYVFSTNLLGFVTFLIMVRRPFQIACPGCGKKRPAGDATCPHCAQTWPAPTPTGAEIFDHERAVKEEALAVG